MVLGRGEVAGADSQGVERIGQHGFPCGLWHARAVCCVVSAVSWPTWLLFTSARWVCCVVCAMSWATWLLFPGAPGPCVALRARCPGPLGSCSPVCRLCLLFCLCGVLGHLAPVHRCARAVCCVASAVSWAIWLLFTGAPAPCGVLRVRCPGLLGSRSTVCPLGVLCCVCDVLGYLAPVRRCACSVCCFACAVSWVTWLLFTGVPARFVLFCLRCPGPLGSCSRVCPLGVLCCVCGVLHPLAPAHRCARWVCCVACAVSWATWLLFTGALARCVALRGWCPGPLGSWSPGCLLCRLFCLCGVLCNLAPALRCARSACCFVCGVLGLLAPVHRCARLWCPVPLLPSVQARVRCPGPCGACSPVCALCAVRVCHWWLCPSSSPPNYRFSLNGKKKKKQGRAYTAGTGTGSWCGGAIVLCPLVCVVGALAAVAPQGCGSCVLMYTGMGQAGFALVSLCFWCWLVRRLCGLWVWAVGTLFLRQAWLGVKG